MTTVLSPVGLTYQLGDLMLNVIDDNECQWVATVEGWDTVPNPIGDAVPRPNDDGADFVDLYLSPKPLTIDGLVLCPTQTHAYRARDQMLTASRLLRRTGELFVNEPIPKRVEVRLGGGPVWEWIDDRNAAFSIPLTAADPLRYAATASTADVGLANPNTVVRAYPRIYDGGLRYRLTVAGAGAPVTVNNAGTAATYPVFTIRGPAVNPTIELVGTGMFMEFEVALGSTDRLVVDASSRSVRLNGSPTRWLLVGGGFFRLPPGESLIAFRGFEYNSLARLTVDYRSAWL